MSLSLSLYIYIYIYKSPYITDGNLVSGGGGQFPIPGTLKEGWRDFGTGHLSGRDSMKGTSKEGSFTRESKDILSKTRKWTSASVGVPLLGNMDRRFFLGSF
jgi:hypothetical protein